MTSQPQPLGDGLVLRVVHDAQDAERYIAFHTKHSSPNEGAIMERLLRRHPRVKWEQCQFVEDTSNGEMVSTTCLIPWQCRFGDVTLKVAMLEMVVTDPRYRQRGLIRHQIERYHQMVADEGYDLSIIQGIPFYYRQFGYTYAVDHFVSDVLPSARIPDRIATSLSWRRACVGDVSDLQRYYLAANAQLFASDVRDAAFWRYLLEWVPYPLWVLEDKPGHTIGYLGASKSEGKPGVRVSESGIADYGVALGALALLKAEAAGGDVQLGWPKTGLLVRLARSIGTVQSVPYQWLLRITNVPALLHKLAPVFETRIVASAEAGWSGDLRLNFYKQAVSLHFVNGQLRSVEPIGFLDASMGAKDPGDLWLPMDAFVRLLVGYRSLEELRDAWPDTGLKDEMRPLLDTLFPKQDVFFYMRY